MECSSPQLALWELDASLLSVDIGVHAWVAVHGSLVMQEWPLAKFRKLSAVSGGEKPSLIVPKFGENLQCM